METARVALGVGRCVGNVNRRQRSVDGTVLLGEDPAGACDKTVRVMRFDRLDGRPLAVAFRYSCHPVTLGPRTNVMSPDFVGTARALVEREMNCVSMFLQGCCGNVNPASGIGQDIEGKEDTLRLGHMLGGEVLKVAAGLRTHRRRKEPVLVRSVGVYWLYEYEPIPPGPPMKVDAVEEEMTLDLAPFPQLQEVEIERQDWAEKLAQANGRSAREWELNPLRRFDEWAEFRLRAARTGPNPWPITFPIQALRIGAILIVALPFEAMTETGNALTEALGGNNVFIHGYSNGLVSYLPTPQISREGGMESKLAYKNFLLPAELPGDWEPQVRAAVLRLAQQVNSDSRTPKQAEVEHG
jgi:hypothetical protein